ncbi:hypothetical protein F5Y18DRAFT_112693 [Xylariaceae sp. FL1019]|nr:hypothetical protein F5Y18DRAFT_112693 [Xylariaceae sp. FL1019]
MRLCYGIVAALLCLRAEANTLRLPTAKRANNVTAAVPPPPGAYIPVPTFFKGAANATLGTTSSPLDLETQAKYSVYLADAGITGFAIFGSTGEPIHVSSKERVQVITATRKALDAAGHTNYPIMAGVVSQLFEEVIDQLYEAQTAGATWGVCLVPGYFAVATSQQGIIDWFTAVADASPLPILIYDYPTVSNNVLVTPSTFAALAQHPNIVGTKLAIQDVSYHAQICSNPAIDYDTFHPYTGLGQLMLPAVAVGAFGALDVVGTSFPKTMVQLYKLSSIVGPTAAEQKQARDLQWKVSTMGEYYNSYNILGIKEAIYRLRGFGDRTGVRLPLLNTITDEQWDAYESIISMMEETESNL